MAVEGEVQLISDLDKEMKVEKQRDGNDNKCEHCDKVLSRKRAMRLHVKRVHLKIKEEIKTENQSDTGRQWLCCKRHQGLDFNRSGGKKGSSSHTHY